MRRWLRRAGAAVMTVVAAYVLLLVHPQPLFAYQLEHAGLVVHSSRPIPPQMNATLERVRARLDRSPLFDAANAPEVFICDSRWLFALFARTNYRVGGLADVAIGQHAYLRPAEMEHDRLIGPSGQLVAADRPLSYFIAHEIMHLVHGQRVGRINYLRLPQWLDDGDADYVARDIDLAKALRDFKSQTRELDPARSGLYLRYHLMVAYELQRKGATIQTLLQSPPDRVAIERDLAQMSAW